MHLKASPEDPALTKALAADVNTGESLFVSGLKVRKRDNNNINAT